MDNLIIETQNILKQAKIKNYKNETLLIISHVLNINKLETKLVNKVSLFNKRKVLNIAKKRAKRVPLQYIFKSVDFLNTKIKVNKNVLIPENETELLCDLVINHIKKHTAQLVVLDLCCGSGCVGVSIAKNTNANVTSSDISNKALKIAKYNASQNNVKINFVKSNMLNNLKCKYDIIVCNPPYINTSDMKLLQKEVLSQPKIALNGGEDGLKFYKTIANNAWKYLNENGVLFLEIGANQEVEIVKLLNKNFNNIKLIMDYNKINRFIIASVR